MKYQTFQFNVSEGTQSLFIAVGPIPPALFRVVGPDDHYKGYIMSGFSFPAIYYSAETRATLNAKKEKPLSGTYTLQLFSFDDTISDGLDCFEVCFNAEADLSLANYEPSVLSTESFWEEKEASGEVQELPRYYKGDLHAHTFLSDGVLTPFQVNQVIEDKALDFVAITDHNLVPMGFGPLKRLYVPSFELTLPKGHLNIHGLLEPDIYKPLFSGSLNEAIKFYASYSHVAINHPFFSPWDFDINELDLAFVHAIELICDPTYPGSNSATEKAVSFFDYLWSRGIRLYAVGGSDSHSDTYADPMTYVFSKSHNQLALLEGLKNGHVMISRKMELLVSYKASYGEILPGSRIDDINDLEAIGVMFRSEALMDLELRVLYNGHLIQSKKIAVKAGECVEYSFNNLELKSAENFHWVRFEIKNTQGEWMAFVNPIYQGTPNQSPGTWGQLMEEYLRHETAQ
ncbi:MAG: CehA/McbA family metallohydrolase [Campylobacterales bacterium]|nr:CehA/McbA family metallohydrolase [Campylobacterales bacterium]